MTKKKTRHSRLVTRNSSMNIPADIEQSVAKAIKKLWPTVDVKIDIVTPPNKEFGDYSCAIALQLAKVVGDSPTSIAEKIKDSLGKIEYIEEVTVTAPGYLNFKLDYPKLAETLLRHDSKFLIPNSTPLNISIEHTSVNPNKAAHIGHLRNACLGDALARILRGVGHTVEVQNYIDDLGVQVADSVVAFETFGDAPEGEKIDKWFWKIYADINEKYEANPKLMERREKVLEEMEKGESETAKQIVEKMVSAQGQTFARFGIDYDLLVYEHDIVNNQLWKKLFDQLKKEKLIVKATDGNHAGAWVVKFGETEREDKILVKSNGLTTYTAKDLAYALWKFGKTDEMKGYENRLSPINLHYNVIDERQTYPQAVIKYVMEKLGYAKEAKNYLHLSYGVVKLSDNAAKQLGIEFAENGEKAHSMSGRAGIGVMVDDLVDTTTAQQIKEHSTEKGVAEKIAIGSIRYYMLKSRPEREIVFDFDEALRTDGNTGVYLQYAYARANNILEKIILSDKRSLSVSSRAQSRDLIPDSSTTVGMTKGMETETTAGLNESEQELIKVLGEANQNIQQAVENADPSLLCDYAYGLASTFAGFYENSPVLQAPDKETKEFRLGLVSSYKEILGQVLDLLGIPILPKL